MQIIDVNLIELAISLGLEIWLIVLLLRRGVGHHFPVFFAYTLYAVVSTAARLLAVHHYRTYFYVYWWTESPYTLLGFAALNEAFRWVFEGFYRLWWFRLLYYGTIAAFLVIAIRNAMVNPPFKAHPLFSLIVVSGTAVDLVQVGIVGLFYGLTKLLDVEFRRYAFGIAVGFGLSSAGSFIGYWIYYKFGTRFDAFAGNTSAVSYILAVGLWVTAFIRPEPDEKEWMPPMSPEQMLREVEGYLKALGISRKK
ncbi:MAG: hypothetical protein LAP21_03810 [Acidobacteriia bacterium]|nr:hypothetical protein [Terriglobia bacterium]